MKRVSLEFLPAALASAGLVAAVVVFMAEASSFRQAVIGWARRDLDTRTALAAATLTEPLKSGDFKVIHGFGAECAADGVRLTVLSGPKGVFFDSVGPDEVFPESMYAVHSCGEYTVRLGLPLSRVLAPFHRAKFGFMLAAIVGGAGMLLVFYITYRQRVRIHELAKLERFRRDFIADMSHELKTPLTGILGAVDLLQEPGQLPPENRAALLDLVKKESVRLNALAQNILSLARLERIGELKSLNRTETDLSELVDDVVERLRPKAEAAGIDLAAEGTSSPSLAQCDPQLIGQAVSNLVENAIRHSGSRDVVVLLERAAGETRISVVDHGVGIPVEERERVFERFHRVDDARAAETGGAGLGLAIVRSIAQLHGGSVALTPATPTGCRFTITLR